MNIDILYNKEIDEFTNDLSLQMRLKRYLTNHFYPAYTIALLAPVYLVGGAIRDLMYAKHPKDLDIVVIGKEHKDWVLEVFDKFNIKYTYNKFGSYKIKYDDTTIDLWLSDDLFDSIQYNVDGIIFDLRTNSLLSLTFNDFINNGINLVNDKNNIENGREKKLTKFASNFKK